MVFVFFSILNCRTTRKDSRGSGGKDSRGSGATHEPIPLEERDQILSDIDNMLNEMGVSATTAVPQLKIAAGIISAPLMAQNTYLTIRNDMFLAPRIKENSPHWYSNNISHLDLGGGYSGGGAGGSYK